LIDGAANTVVNCTPSASSLKKHRRCVTWLKDTPPSQPYPISMLVRVLSPRQPSIALVAYPETKTVLRSVSVWPFSSAFSSTKNKALSQAIKLSLMIGQRWSQLRLVMSSLTNFFDGIRLHTDETEIPFVCPFFRGLPTHCRRPIGKSGNQILLTIDEVQGVAQSCINPNSPLA